MRNVSTRAVWEPLRALAQALDLPLRLHPV